MCDTFVVLGDRAASGRTTLAKNSDREPNEAQYLTRVAAQDHAPGATLRCTFITVPQVAHTYGVLGSRPWWMWGFEHGLNECGLVIGNEALWSRLPASTEPGLLGMDLLRLTLERAATAAEGLDVLIVLLERYGQSGPTSATRVTSYHNSFILADGAEAWILETAGRHWAAKRVAGWGAISNVYSIGADYDRISRDAIAFATAQGWFDPAAGKPFDFAAAYADTDVPFLPSCAARLIAARHRLSALEARGPLDFADIAGVLRSHGAEDPDAADWRPGAEGESLICMHATATSGSETAAAAIVELPLAGEDPRATLFWAALASPCLSSFVPIWLDSGVPDQWTQPDAKSQGANADAWWEMESLQRLIERDYGRLAAAPRALLAQLEADARAAVAALPRDADARTRRALMQDLAERQRSAVRALTALTESCLAGAVTPRTDDPRGDYLTAAAAERLPTHAGSRAPTCP
jgi:dipeptidase